MKKAKTMTKDICEQLDVPKSTFLDWVREAKDAGTWSETPGQISRPAPRKKAPGTGTMNRKISDKAKEIKTKITALKDISNQMVNKILSNELGMKSFVAPKKPMLTPDQVEFRDDWGHFHKGWGKRRWNGVLFSDETHIEI